MLTITTDTDTPVSRRAGWERLWKALEEAQAQSVINGTDKMTMEEIDEVIAEVRAEKRVRK